MSQPAQEATLVVDERAGDIAAWSKMHGLIGFGLFGQTRSMTSHAEALIDATVTVLTDTIGLLRR